MTSRFSGTAARDFRRVLWTPQPPYLRYLPPPGKISRGRHQRSAPKDVAMAQLFPYAFYSCPCVDSAPGKLTSAKNGEASLQPPDDEDDENTFDSQSPRANFSLYPIEHLLYCTDCHQIRCPRCTAEEIVCWYCPNCLFEVPSSTVRSDGNR